jgi:tRNA 2-thiouridine synthesizing protein A
MKDEINIDETLDCIGLFCPEPLFQTRTKLDEIEIGEIIEVFADDPAAEEDIKRLIKRTGQELIKFEDDNGEFTFIIKKIK